jgi:hypothetical protein
MLIGADVFQYEEGLVLREVISRSFFMQLGRGLRFSFPCINEQLARQKTPCNAVVTFASISPNSKLAYGNRGCTHVSDVLHELTAV